MSSPVATIPIRPPMFRRANGTTVSTATVSVQAQTTMSPDGSREGSSSRRPVTAANSSSAVNAVPAMATGCRCHGHTDSRNPATQSAPNNWTLAMISRSSQVRPARCNDIRPTSTANGSTQSTPSNWVRNGTAHAATNAPNQRAAGLPRTLGRPVANRCVAARAGGQANLVWVVGSRRRAACGRLMIGLTVLNDSGLCVTLDPTGTGDAAC